MAVEMGNILKRRELEVQNALIDSRKRLNQVSGMVIGVAEFLGLKVDLMSQHGSPGHSATIVLKGHAQRDGLISEDQEIESRSKRSLEIVAPLEEPKVISLKCKEKTRIMAIIGEEIIWGKNNDLVWDTGVIIENDRQIREEIIIGVIKAGLVSEDKVVPLIKEFGISPKIIDALQ